MSKESVVKLFRDSQSDRTLREKLNQAPNLETFIRLAGERGYKFTAEEWRESTRFSVEEMKGDLSEIPGI